MKDNGGENGFGAVLGANAAAAVAEALRSRATTGAQVRDAMEKIGTIKGYAAGPIKYSPTDHDSWGPQTLLVRDRARWQVQEPLKKALAGSRSRESASST